MNKNKIGIKMLMALVFLVLTSIFSACEKTSNDPCDDTVEPEKAVTLKVTVHVLNLNDEPIADELVNLKIYKTPCGEDSKGYFTFNVNTNAIGTVMSSVVGYNLRNSKDQVVAFAVAPELENYFQQNFMTEVFTYGDFFSGSMKEVHLYIYSQEQ